MAQLTVAQMRAIAQELVMDTNASAPGLATADWLVLLNDALQAYAGLYPDSLGLSGLVGTVTLNAATSSANIVPTASYVIRNVTGAFLTGSATGPMTRDDVLTLLRLQSDKPTLGKPTVYSLESQTPGVTTGNVYKMRVHPIPDGSYSINVFGDVQPGALTADADYSVFQDAECRLIARMAAIDGARQLGRSDGFVQSIALALPDRIKAQMGVMARDTQPRTYAGKSVA